MERSEVENLLARFELAQIIKIKEEVQSSLDGPSKLILELEGKVRSMRQRLNIAATVAVIFGVGGAWGYSVLSKATSEINELQSKLSTATHQIKSYEQLVQSHSDELEELNAKAAKSATEQLSKAVTTAIDDFQQGVKSGELRDLKIRGRLTAEEVWANRVIVTGKGGGIYLTIHKTGGRLSIVGGRDKDSLVEVGPSANGGGDVVVFDKQGRENAFSTLSRQ